MHPVSLLDRSISTKSGFKKLCENPVFDVNFCKLLSNKLRFKINICAETIYKLQIDQKNGTKNLIFNIVY